MVGVLVQLSQLAEVSLGSELGDVERVHDGVPRVAVMPSRREERWGGSWEHARDDDGGGRQMDGISEGRYGGG